MSKLSHSGKIFPPISPELQMVLQHIVNDVVEALGCTGAMVATLEGGYALPVRAYAVDIAPNLLQELESRLGVSFIGPKSVAYLNEARFKENLSIRAVKGQDGHPEIVTSDSLYDLFRPIVSRFLSGLAQRLTGIKQVVAVPFFLEDEVVGNLFAASRREFSERDIDFLKAFGKQASFAIQSQRRLAEIQALERVILALQSSITDETQILQTIVEAVVQKLSYSAALVAPLQSDNTLPFKAYSVDTSSDFLKRLETKLGVSVIGSHSVVDLNDERFKDNLGVRAIKGADDRPEIITSDSLYDLFRPIVDRKKAELVQRISGIKQVIAVPFFLENEVVGALFVTSHRPTFSEREKDILSMLGRQAAVGIRNARLYKTAEERRHIAQMFGKLAFSATAYIHALRNHIGISLTYLQLLDKLSNFPPEKQSSLLETAPEFVHHLGKAVDILDHLHEPWHQTPDKPISINDCLNTALGKVYSELRGYPELHGTHQVKSGVTIHRDFAEDLPLLEASPDMTIEAFRVLIKNAGQALEGNEQQGELWVESKALDKNIIQVIIRDNGTGIREEHLEKIFEMGWSTREGKGMGFGLFWTKDYIEGLGGEISVESVWREGTAFCVRLPGVEPTS